MPSVSQPSPYAEPNTPIASAKRPRTAVRHTGTPHQHHHAKHGHGAHDAAAAGGAAGSSQGSLLQSPPPACQLEQPSPDGGGGGAEAEHGEGEGSEGSWKGRVVSFFSPVLKFVGGHEQEEGGGVCAGEDLAGGDENDSNLENRGPAAVANAGGAALQLHKEESEGAASASSAADAMDVEAPAEEGGGEVVEEEEGEEEAGYEGEEEEDEEELEVVEEFNPFLFIKQLPPYEHVRAWRFFGVVDWLTFLKWLPGVSSIAPYQPSRSLTNTNTNPSPPKKHNTRWPSPERSASRSAST